MNKNYQHIQELCKKHMHAYVLAETVDGKQLDGIITGLDDEYVYIAVPIDQNSREEHQSDSRSFQDEQQFRYGYGHSGYGYGYPGYGNQGGYGGYGYGRPRRFNRLALPLAALTALSILPWY